MAINNPIANLFGSSPIKPMQKHMSTVVSAAVELKDFFEASFEGQWDQAEELYNAIVERKEQADEINRELRMNMPKGLFMPISRGDLLTIINEQDSIAHKAKAIASITYGRQQEIPNKLQKSFMNFLDSAIVSCERAMVAINELDELLETGFSGREVKVVQRLIRKIEKHQDKVELNERKLRQRVFKQEKKLPPVDAIFLYESIRNISSMSRKAREIGHLLELLVAK